MINRLTSSPRVIPVKFRREELIIFQVLKEGKNFQRSGKCEVAFHDLKTYLKEIPLLMRPNIGESVYLYLGVSHG